MAAARGAIGKYGRCGSIITLAFFGIMIVPAPNGQTPASARNSVDLPEPDGPLTSTRSPRPIEMSLALTSGTPFGSRTARSLKVTLAPSLGATVIAGGDIATARAAATD